MYGESHAETEWTEGEVTLHSGDVVRMNAWDAFADSVILGFNDGGKPTAKVSRPYVYASGVGTTGPVPLLGCETYELPVEHILKHYKVIDNDGHRRV